MPTARSTSAPTTAIAATRPLSPATAPMAPAAHTRPADSLKTIGYEEFLEVVVNGRKNVSSGSSR